MVAPSTLAGTKIKKPTDRLTLLRDQLDLQSGAAPPPQQQTVPVPMRQQTVPMPNRPTPHRVPGVAPLPSNGIGSGSGTVVGDEATVTIPPPAAPPPAPPPTTMEEDQEAFIRSLLGDALNVDTSAQEQLIREEMDRLQGMKLRDSRARAGVSGMASSGSQIALENTLNKDAARDVSGRILDVRDDAKQTAIHNALAGIGVDIDLLDAKTQAELLDGIMDLFGDDSPVQDSPGEDRGAFSPPEVAVDNDDDGVDDHTGASEDFNTHAVDPAVRAQAEDWDSGLPFVPHLTEGYQGSDGEYDYMKGVDGKIWRFPIGGAH